MVKEQLVALTTQVEAELEEALETIAHLAQRAKYTEAHIGAKLAAIQAVLAAPFEDPRETTVAITAGTPVEQPRIPPGA